MVTRQIIENQIQHLHPGCFALIMATGIVSIVAHLLGIPAVAWLLFGLNLVAYSVLWLLTAVRLVRHFQLVRADLASHTRGTGFFTTIAAT